MNRRTFLQRLTWVAAAATVLPKVTPGPKTLGNDCVFVSFTPAPLHAVDDNWFAWHEQMKQIAQQDYEVRTFSLNAAEGGYRRARVEVMSAWTGKSEVWTWDQPWSREAHYRENLHMNFAPCSDCETTTHQPHARGCKFATALAHKLGQNLEGFRVESDLITARTSEYQGPWKS
jgi:hypothetical protein